MTKKPLTISLVIPARDEESYLENCLLAAVSQDEPFYEIIVVDNGSADLTARIAERFAGVKVLCEPQKGIVFARSRGFDAARGDIIARIDADTVLPPDWSAHIRSFYEDPRHEAFAWTCSGMFSDAPLPRLVSGGYRLVAVHINRWLTGYPTLWGSSMALPAAVWQQIKPKTCRGRGFHEDLDLTTHLHREGYKIFWDKNMLVTAQLRHARTSNRELWEYLQWWPRTLRRHGQKTWVICWLGGTLAMYVATVTFFGLYRRLSKLLASADDALALP